MYKPGGTVYHPAHGIGQVQSIEEKEMLGSTTTFATILFHRERLNVMVPASTLKEQVRPPVDRTEALEILDYLEDWDGHLDAQWKTRSRENQQRLESGDPYDLCHVVKGLYRHHNKNGQLNNGDRKHLDRSLDLLAGELACALDAEADAMAKKITARCRAPKVAA